MSHVIHKILLVVFLFASSFFTVTHFYFTPANISHFLTTALKFSCFVANEVRLLWFFWVFLFLFFCFIFFFSFVFLFCFFLISCSSSFSLSHVNVRQKKFSRERGFFLSPSLSLDLCARAPPPPPPLSLSLKVWVAKRTITWTSIIKLNTGCRLHTKLKKGQFTLVTLWCGRTGWRLRDYQNFSDAWIPIFS